MLRRISLLCALAATVIGVSAPAASAGFDQDIDTNGGIVWFSHFGDEVGAKDQRRDGLAVQAVVVWHDRNGKTRQVFVGDFSGADERVRTRKLPIPEGARVVLTMCYVDDLGPGDCSGQQIGQA